MTTSTALRRLLDDAGALLAEHGRGAPLTAFEEYATDPLRFCREVLRVALWGKQEAVVASVLVNPQTVVVGANGAGKDHIAACLALWWAMANRGMVLVMAAVERQVRHVMFGEIGRLFSQADRLPGQLFEQALRVPGEHAGILGFVSNDVSRLTGFHHPRLLVILSEAQGVPDIAFEAAHSNAIGADSRILAVGNPLFATGAFHRAAHSSAWVRVDMPASEHPNVRTGRRVIPGAVSREGVARLAREYGENSQTYRSRVLAQFPTENAEGLIRGPWLETAAAAWPDAVAEARAAGPPWVPHHLGGPREPSTVVAGLDVARAGPDKTALAIRRGKVLLELVTWERLDTMETVGRLLAELKRMGFPLVTAERARYVSGPRTDRLVVDAIGVGGGVYDRLLEQGFPVREYNASRSPSLSKEREQFLNSRARDWWHLRRLLEQERIALPRHEELFEELRAVEWKHHSTGKIAIEPKEDLRARLGRSPDVADAVVMAFADFEAPTGAKFESVRIRWA